MGRTAVVYSCGHADGAVDNSRFSVLGNFLFDLKPDYVVDLGDGADMRSLQTYDSRNPQAVVNKNYEEDIEVYNDAQERIRHPFVRSRKRRPTFYGFEGNHEHRIKKALSLDPQLEGNKYGISFDHLQTNRWFNEYYEYKDGGPGTAEIDGVLYAHYLSTGNFGSAMSGIHHAYKLIQTKHASATVGHSHKRGIYFQDGAHPRPKIGCVVGCMKGKNESWAGQSNGDWWRGVVVKREIENGVYEPQFISYRTLEKEYA